MDADPIKRITSARADNVELSTFPVDMFVPVFSMKTSTQLILNFTSFFFSLKFLDSCYVDILFVVSLLCVFVVYLIDVTQYVTVL